MPRAEVLEQKQFPWGDDPAESLANYASRWKTGPEPVGRAEFEMRTGFAILARTFTNGARTGLDADYYRCFAAAQSSRPSGVRVTCRSKTFGACTTSVTRRFLAAFYQGVALRSAVKHSSRISIRRLWIPGGLRHYR
jgi:hypothetical protein